MTTTTHDIALNAYHSNLARDYEPVPGETSYRLFHPTNDELSIVFNLEHDEEGNVDGWSYAEYELDEHGEWQLIGEGGDHFDLGEDEAEIGETIGDTLANWAN